MDLLEPTLNQWKSIELWEINGNLYEIDINQLEINVNLLI